MTTRTHISVSSVVLGLVCLAAAGTLTPLLAAVVHVSSEMAFILNSARLVPVSNLKRNR